MNCSTSERIWADLSDAWLTSWRDDPAAAEPDVRRERGYEDVANRLVDLQAWLASLGCEASEGVRMLGVLEKRPGEGLRRLRVLHVRAFVTRCDG